MMGRGRILRLCRQGPRVAGRRPQHMLAVRGQSRGLIVQAAAGHPAGPLAARPRGRDQTWRQVADQLRARCSKLGICMDEAEQDVLAYISSPSSIALFPTARMRTRGSRSVLRFAGAGDLGAKNGAPAASLVRPPDHARLAGLRHPRPGCFGTRARLLPTKCS